ncbi:MAG: hypothetical protein JSV03_10760 [Planctomycetota bacterium]|nr:MAG: hypothetical protein JSV03_10760 [Planctomycetota bacterium]
MQAVNMNPNVSQVRTFGLVMLGGLCVIGAVLWYKGLLPAAGWWPDAGWGWRGNGWHVTAVILWGSGILFAATCIGSYVPGRILYVVWMTIAMYLGMVMSTFLLSILFFLLLPIFSLIRFKDPLRLKLKQQGSYWEEHDPHEATLDRTRRPF